MLIRLITDTNILMAHMNELDELLNKRSDHLQLIIPRIVLKELDSLKNIRCEARNAVNFIKTYYKTNKVKVEGQGSVGKMEIEEEIAEDIKELEKGNNDDKILRFVFDHNECIFLTKDKILGLKAESYYVNYILIENEFNIDSIIAKINKFKENKLKHYKNEDMEIDDYAFSENNIKNEKQYADAYQQNYEKQVFHIVHKIIEQLAENKGLKDFRILSRKSNIKIVDLIDFTVKNFNSFNDFLSNNSKTLLVEIRNDLQVNKDVIENLKKLLIIFRQAHIH